MTTLLVSNRYHSLSHRDLLKLPVPELANPGCLIAVWVTNKQAQHRFVRDSMFLQWNVKFTAQWFWLKVTVTAQFAR